MFQGSIVALVTPMHADGSLDMASWQQLLEWHLQEGSHGIVVAGTTGESATLSQAEFKQLLRAAVTTLGGKIPVLAGTGTNATTSTIQRTQLAQQLGADGALVVTPYYNRPSQEGLIAHYEQLANNSDLPLVLYNVPTRTGVDMQPETVAHLSQLDAFVALKEANAEPDRLPALLQAVQSDFDLLSGDDPSCAYSIANGAQGVISVVANAAPAAMGRLAQQALQANQKAEATKKLVSMGDNDDNSAHAAPDYTALDTRLQALYELANLGGNPTGIKWCLWQSQRIQRGIRLPLTWLHPDLEAQAKQLYQDVSDLVT